LDVKYLVSECSDTLYGVVSFMTPPKPKFSLLSYCDGLGFAWVAFVHPHGWSTDDWVVSA